MLTRSSMSSKSVFLFHNFAAQAKHVPPSSYFPERPLRFAGIQDVLDSTGLWEKCINCHVESGFTRDQLVRAYGEREVSAWENAVRDAARRNDSIMDKRCGDIYWSEHSLDAVKTAAGAAVEAVEAVLRASAVHDSLKHAFVAVRPPGHHCFNLPAGFCIANNVVLAAQRALCAGKRVAIIDWDYHFGDGTAEAFLREDRVMFCSLHCAYDRTGHATYPDHHLKGDSLCKRTEGRMFNIQWQRDDADNCAYAYAFERAVLPALRRFAPDIILVSAGYDAIAGDSLAGMELTPHAFFELTLGLKSLGVPVVCVLEGGYDPILLGNGVAKTIEALLSDKPSTLDALASIASEAHKAVVDSVAAALKLSD